MSCVLEPATSIPSTLMAGPMLESFTRPIALSGAFGEKRVLRHCVPRDPRPDASFVHVEVGKCNWHVGGGARHLSVVIVASLGELVSLSGKLSAVGFAGSFHW